MYVALFISIWVIFIFFNRMFKSKENIDFFSLIFTTSNDFIFDNIYHFSYKNNEIIENSSGLHET